MFAPLVDAITGRVSAWKAKNSAAYVTLVDPTTGMPYAADGGVGTPVLDNAGVRWLWFYDADTATSTYVNFTTGAVGTPTFPVTPDADTSVQVSNFPATQAVTGPLTDAQLRATAVPVAPNVTRGGGNIDANTQRVTLAADGPGVAALGTPADAAATTDTGSFSILAFIKRGMQNWTTLLTRIPALDNSRTPVLPSMASGGNLSLTTAVVGSNYTAFTSQVCKQLTVSNQAGVMLEVQQGGAGASLQIPSGTFYTFFGITNANQLGVRRLDTSNTPVTVTARWEA